MAEFLMKCRPRFQHGPHGVAVICAATGAGTVHAWPDNVGGISQVGSVGQRPRFLDHPRNQLALSEGSSCFAGVITPIAIEVNEVMYDVAWLQLAQVGRPAIAAAIEVFSDIGGEI